MVLLDVCTSNEPKKILDIDYTKRVDLFKTKKEKEVIDYTKRVDLFKKHSYPLIQNTYGVT